MKTSKQEGNRLHHLTQEAREHPHLSSDISPNLGKLADIEPGKRVVRYQLPSGHICVTGRVAVNVIPQTASSVLHWLQPPAIDLPAGIVVQQWVLADSSDVEADKFKA